MPVRDKCGSLLHRSDLVTVGDLLGTVREFEEDEPFEVANAGTLTGQVVVDVDGGEEVRLPTYAVGVENVCYDVELA